MRSIKWGWVVLASTLAACGRGQLPVVAIFPRDVTVCVAVSDEVAKTDTGNVAAMVDAIDSDLHEDGRTASIVGARLDEKPPLPRVELQVMSSASGNREALSAGKLTQLLSPVTGVALIGAGSGHMLVDAYVVQANGRAVYLGRYSGSSFGSMSNEDVAAGEEVGHDIARTIR